MSDTQSTYIHCRVNEQVATAAKLAATKEDRSLSYIIRAALEEYLQKRGLLADRD